MKKSKRREKNNSPQRKESSTSPIKERNISNLKVDLINNDSKSFSRQIWRNFAQRYSTKLSLSDAMKVSQLEVKFDELTDKRITKIFNKWKFRFKWRLMIRSQIKKSNINNLHKYVQRYRFSQRQKWIHYTQFMFKFQKEDSFYAAIEEYQNMRLVFDCFTKWFNKFEFIDSGKRDLILQWKDFKQRLIAQDLEERINEIIDEEEIRKTWKKFSIFLRKDSIQHAKERDEFLHKFRNLVKDYVKYERRTVLEDAIHKMEQREKWNDMFLIVRKNELRRIRQEDFNKRNEKRVRHAFFVWSNKSIMRSATKKESRHVFLDSVSAYTYSAANQSAFMIQQFYQENRQRIFTKKYLLTKYFFNWALRRSTSVTSQLLNETPPLETAIETPIDQNISDFVSINEGNVVSTLSRIYYYRHKNEVNQQKKEAAKRQRAIKVEEESTDEDLDQNVVQIHDPNENTEQNGTNLRFVDATTVTSKTSLATKKFQFVHIPETVQSEPSPKFIMIEDCAKDIRKEMADIFSKRLSPFVVHLEILTLQSFGSVTFPENEYTTNNNLSSTSPKRVKSPHHGNNNTSIASNNQQQETPQASSTLRRRRKKKDSPSPQAATQTKTAPKSNIRVTSQFFKTTPLYAAEPLKEEEEVTKSLRKKKKRSPKKEDLSQTEPLRKRKKVKVKKSPPPINNVIPPEESDDPYQEHDSDVLYTPQSMRRRQFFSDTLPDKKDLTEKRRKKKTNNENTEEHSSTNTFSLNEDSNKYYSENDVHKKKTQKPPPPLASPAPFQDKTNQEQNTTKQEKTNDKENNFTKQNQIQLEDNEEEESESSSQQHEKTNENRENEPIKEYDDESQYSSEHKEQHDTNIEQSITQQRNEPIQKDEEEESEDNPFSPIKKLLNMSFKQTITSTVTFSVATNFYGFNDFQFKRSVHRNTKRRMNRTMRRITKLKSTQNIPQTENEQNKKPQDEETTSKPNEGNQGVNFSMAPPRGGVDLTIDDLDNILGPNCIIDTVRDIFTRIEPFMPFDPIKIEKHVNFVDLKKESEKQQNQNKTKEKQNKKKEDKDLISSTLNESFNNAIVDLTNDSVEKLIITNCDFLDVYFDYPFT